MSLGVASLAGDQALAVAQAMLCTSTAIYPLIAFNYHWKTMVGTLTTT
jgi:hypothetical protein